MKIHCIEGLGCYYLRPLTKAVQSLNLNVEVVTYPWTVKPEKIYSQDGDIFCYHSFGISLLKRLIWRTGQFHFVVDGREPPLGTPYRGPMLNSMDTVYNYYQNRFVVGYPIQGAENRLVTGFSHYRMPRNPAFLIKLMEVVHSAKAANN